MIISLPDTTVVDRGDVHMGDGGIALVFSPAE
jgi:hypothetical protein